MYSTTGRLRCQQKKRPKNSFVSCSKKLSYRAGFSWILTLNFPAGWQKNTQEIIRRYRQAKKRQTSTEVCRLSIRNMYRGRLFPAILPVLPVPAFRPSGVCQINDYLQERKYPPGGVRVLSLFLCESQRIIRKIPLVSASEPMGFISC